MRCWNCCGSSVCPRRTRRLGRSSGRPATQTRWRARPIILIDGVIDESQVLELLRRAAARWWSPSRRPLPGLFGGAAWHFALRPLQPAGIPAPDQRVLPSDGSDPGRCHHRSDHRSSRWYAGTNHCSVTLDGGISQSRDRSRRHAEPAVLEAVASRLRSAFRDSKDAARELPNWMRFRLSRL